MRRQTRTLLLAGASFLSLGGLALAEQRPAEPIIIAQADTAGVAAAEQAVAEARAALELAETAGKGVKKAQNALDKALAQLDAAKSAATPPPPPTEEVVEDLREAAPPAEEAVTEAPADVAEEPAPPPAETVIEQPAPEPPTEDVAVEPAPEPQPEAVAEEPAPPPADVAEEPAPAPVEEVAEEPAPTPPAETVVEEPAAPAPAENVAEEPAPAPKAKDQATKPAAKPQTGDTAKQPAPPARQTAEEPAAQPDATPKAEQAAKPRKPRGDGPRKGPPPELAEKPAEKPAKPLPENAEAIREGQKVEAAGGRVIERERGQVVIRHDDEERFRSENSRYDRERGADGRTVITVERPNGDAIITVRDADGDIVKRTKLTRDGREIVLINNERRGPRNEPPRYDLGNILPPIVLNIPLQDYIVESRRASPQIIYQTLIAPPVEVIEQPYTLEEVRYNERVRDMVRRVDVDTVTFDFGQAYVPESQIDALDGIARAIQAAIDRDEREIFLVEGHTDAVGSELANLALSDRRAESVAEILTYYYDIPPENLITQGYGESDLKVQTLEAERQNRRVTLRRITPLISAGN
ncbi:MAG: OmpA family protein [Bauldia litoralis]